MKIEFGGLPGILTILFVALKIAGYIDWSWWWVLAPLWISALFGMAFLFLFLLMMAIALVVAHD